MSYLVSHFLDIAILVAQHLQMTGIALAIAMLVAVPVAILVTQYRWLTVPVLGALGVLYTIPSLALIIFLIPLFGLSRTSVIVAMVLYTQVILVRNLSVGLANIAPAILEAAQGMGMGWWQQWWWIQVPLVMPVFIAGLRIAAVVAIAIATIGAKFNAGGLGKLLFDGIQTNRLDKIWIGAIAVGILALGINSLLLWLEHRCTHPGSSATGPAGPT